MEKFETRFRGYDITQVNKFIDEVIKEYESLLNKSKECEREIENLKEKLTYYENIESTLNHAMFNAESKGDQIRKLANEEASRIINDARKNANRIINEALLKAERANDDADRLRRNINHLKRRLRSVVEGQLEVIEELETIDYRSNDRDGIY